MLCVFVIKIISSTIFDEMSTKCRFDENKFDEASSLTKLPVDKMTCRRSNSRQSVVNPEKESVSKNKVDTSKNLRRIIMKFSIHIAFPILTFHHQNFTLYHVRLVRHHHFFL